ncbi:DNA-formamidopyrimidine glycosylase family protein [Nocardia cyriacigeorgica]|uniref:DNA-(apurinic or apyrimidinic site) lyase n=1 Tax=Nocardia cyriacigeorgica TaxID=135487 RepID=A0A4U8W8S7_9NOCA|nr:DNA-formamidopyrimidine glycosylase family protein [Nocardia cyriacigeorgica]MBF6162248.1 Fpg/Nei family DNA glycosylase [Nocardia cyriacigeorgica]MBF6201207.1 Fpg/Nei family DNA glycosylase [Nocardia cyriacigeorgica]MBF6319705.1 Fpg/Nei family DNA glycosylase [Nocardia cyriacigeorgica]MBF6347003.1 Fpg/Nei family DNA glycosylase [Nocardia cyriacigeorgica]MBF6516586.1 Fpg/Nei family DNA glycosylase [Nocardia cyriacigeorgica]
MPEGDVVYRTAERLRAALAGQVLTRSDFRVPRYATVDLRGQTVDSVGSYGKHLFVRTDTVSIHTHLKMEGSWRVFHCGQRWTKPRVTARLVLATDEVEAVGFSLGVVEVLRRAEEQRVIEHLGPDLLGPNWDPAEAVERLARRPDEPIGIALLDQRNLAGIGNIYRSEVCFLRRVHPATPVAAVPDLLALVNEAHRVLTAAAQQPPWRPLVYGRHRMPCQRCGTTIAVEMLGETAPPSDRMSRRERGIYFCPRCQPAVSM